MKPRINLDREYGIVLEGGGARGAYQVGAWRALREAGVKIKGISGTSVGALNGVMMCMDELEKAEEVWENMDYSMVLDVDAKVIDSLKKMDFRSLNFTEMAAEVKKAVKGGGLNIDPLKKLIAEVVDEEKVRNSPRECFATTFSVTERKEVNFDLKTAAEGTMKDILLASSYFPGFKNDKLFGKTYMDGGSINNVPINVLTDRGYKDIIVIRIYGIGVDREKLFNLPDDVTVHRIAPRRNLGGILEFDGEKAKRNLKLGYMDAMRVIYGLEGRKYYIYMPYSEAYYFDKMMSEMAVLQLYLTPYVKEDDISKISGYRTYTEKIFPYLAKKLKLEADWDYRDLYGAFLEICARKMELEVLKIYSAEDIIERVHKILGKKVMVQ
ncbi:MAG: patatin-like phospholipase family protein [Lachnospiraceae bacterium]|nr:patatin-like phospholipase family protein [Lachnospiraceae bacterium]